jgi:xylose isomerase
MSVVVKQGGLAPGGLNFDCKVRRESVDPEDLFIGHVAAMDCYALGLRKAVAMVEDGSLGGLLEQRYLTWSTEDLGQKIDAGKATLEECVAYAQSKGQPVAQSGKQELFEAIRNRFLFG